MAMNPVCATNTEEPLACSLASLEEGLLPKARLSQALRKKMGEKCEDLLRLFCGLPGPEKRLNSSHLDPHPSRPRMSPQTQLQDKGFSMNHLPFSLPGSAHPGHPSLLFVLLCSVVISCVIS